MDWWHKIRRSWTSLSTRIKLRKSAAGVAGSRVGGVGEFRGGGDIGGLMKLRDDVQMCGYRDVEIMWNMLSLTLQPPQPMESATTQRRISTKAKLPRSKQRSISRLFFCTNP